jgi:hypothetical protein
MSAPLATIPKLAQLALKRQPWNPEEKAAGGICELHPEWFSEKRWLYTKHTAFFTTNPCLYRKDIMDFGWPQEENSEGKFSIMLRDAGYHFGLWQLDTFDPPKVTHIGEQRMGTGY